MTPFKETADHFLESAFGVHPHEQRKALLMQVHIFLIISTLLIVKPTVSALFLSNFGIEQLPIAFICVAIIAAVVSNGYSHLLNRFPLQKIIQRSTWVSIFSLLFFGILLNLRFMTGAVLYLFYVWVAIFALLATSQFWVQANILFNAREAKRLFGFIGAGAIAGGIFGGYLTSILANFINSESLPLVAAAILAICPVVIKKIWAFKKNDPTQLVEEQKDSAPFKVHPLQLIAQSKHLSYLAGIVGLSVIVAKLVEYQFSGIAAAHIPDPDELTAFFAFWFSTINLVSLFMQLFLTRKVVGNFGVGPSLFFLPAFILLASVGMLLLPGVLAAAILLKLADGSLKQSINKAAIELVIMPISAAVKNRTKTFIDVVVDSLATGISGLLLLGVVEAMGLSIRSVSLLVIFFIGLWLYLAKKVQQEYVRSFKVKLEAGYRKSSGLGRPFDLKSPTSLARLQQLLTENDEGQLLFALRTLRQLKKSDFIPSILPLLKHKSGDIRAEAVSTLYHFTDEEVVSEIIPLTEDTDPKVRAYAYEYLLSHSANGDLEIIEEYLHFSDEWTRNSAIVTLAREHRKKPKKKTALTIKKHIRNQLAKMMSPSPELVAQRKITMAKAIGFGRIRELYDQLFKFLSDQDEVVVKQSILSAGDTSDPIFIERLVRLLADEHYRPSAIQGLATFGKAVIPEIKQLMDAPNFPLAALQQVPNCLNLIPSQPTVDFLFSLLDHGDLIIRRDALRSLNALHHNYPELKFNNKGVVKKILWETKLYQYTLAALGLAEKTFQTNKPTDEQHIKIAKARASFIKLLNQRLDRNLERIFRLLGLKYPTKDIMVIYHGLKSSKEERRVNALEFLENLLDANLRRAIVPILESSMIESVSENFIHKIGQRIPSEYECFEQLLNSKDLLMKKTVLLLIAEMRDPKFQPLVMACTVHGRPEIKSMAQKIITSFEANAQRA